MFTNLISQGVQEELLPDVIYYELKFAQIDEGWGSTQEQVSQDQEEKEDSAAITRFVTPQKGDLVLRRRFKANNSLVMKLYTKWDGLYFLDRIAKSGVSGDLKDLKRVAIAGMDVFESLKVFVPR